LTSQERPAALFTRNRLPRAWAGPVHLAARLSPPRRSAGPSRVTPTTSQGKAPGLRTRLRPAAASLRPGRLAGQLAGPAPPGPGNGRRLPHAWLTRGVGAFRRPADPPTLTRQGNGGCHPRTGLRPSPCPRVTPGDRLPGSARLRPPPGSP